MNLISPIVRSFKNAPRSWNMRYLFRKHVYENPWRTELSEFRNLQRELWNETGNQTWFYLSVRSENVYHKTSRTEITFDQRRGKKGKRKGDYPNGSACSVINTDKRRTQEFRRLELEKVAERREWDAAKNRETDPRGSWAECRMTEEKNTECAARDLSKWYNQLGLGEGINAWKIAEPERHKD